MSKNRKFKWFDEEDDTNQSNRKDSKSRRDEKRMRNALRGKNFEYLIHSTEEE